MKTLTPRPLAASMATCAALVGLAAAAHRGDFAASPPDITNGTLVASKHEGRFDVLDSPLPSKGHSAVGSSCEFDGSAHKAKVLKLMAEHKPYTGACRNAEDVVYVR